jgi:hypothetical protein
MWSLPPHLALLVCVLIVIATLNYITNHSFVGIDVALVLAIAMLLKDRKEKERYRHIDMKTGAGGGF